MSIHDDQDLQEFLEGDNDYRRAYRALPKVQPPAALDEAIVAAARAQIKRDTRPGWLVPLSLAATIVLGVGLSVRQLTPHTAHLSEQMVMSDSPTAEAADAQAPVAKSVEHAVLARPNERVLSAPAGVPEMTEAAAAVREDSSASAPDASAQAIADAQRERSAAVAARARPTQQSLPAQSGRDKGYAPAPDVSAPPPPARVANDAPTVRRESLTILSDEVLHSRAYVPPPAAEAKQEVDRQIVIVTGDRMDVYTLGEPTPGERLEEIRALQKAGRDREARRLFDEFLEVWPDYELPKDFPLQRQ